MTLAVIVTYNPEIKRLLENINSIEGQVDEIIIVDNNSKNIEKIKEIITLKKINIILNKVNGGIAKALNQALDYAKKNMNKFILTLDQDSICSKNMVENLKKGFEISEKIAIVSPTIFDINTKKNMTKNLSEDYEEVEWVITSGSLCKTEYLVGIGGFKEELFIDYVDAEICLNLKNNGYKVMLSKNIVLKHEVGKTEIKKFLNINFYVTNHSAERFYYMLRNLVILLRNYKKEWKLKILKKIMCIILFEKDKINKLKKAFYGIKDGYKINLFIKGNKNE